MSRQFFTAAKQKGLITDNPFVGVKGGHQRNPERLFMVDADVGLPESALRACRSRVCTPSFRLPSEPAEGQALLLMAPASRRETHGTR